MLSYVVQLVLAALVVNLALPASASCPVFASIWNNYQTRAAKPDASFLSETGLTQAQLNDLRLTFARISYAIIQAGNHIPSSPQYSTVVNSAGVNYIITKSDMIKYLKATCGDTVLFNSDNVANYRGKQGIIFLENCTSRIKAHVDLIKFIKGVPVCKEACDFAACTNYFLREMN